MTKKHDLEIIESLGGTKAVCDLLNSKHQHYSHSRIIQWTKRGIPAAIKLAYPEIFTTDLKRVS
jgi:hypothetical protein